MEEVPVRPIGRRDIHILETALLVGTLFRSDVLEEIKSAEDRVTWVDSLAVAAAALAREKAGMTVPSIAEELGRSEGTIRNHLSGKTKAGQLVRETYERILREGLQLQLPIVEGVGVVSKKEVESLKEEVEKAKNKIRQLEEENKKLKEKIEKALDILKS